MHSIVTSDQVVKTMASNVENHWRNWYGDKYNDTLALALRRERWVSISSTVSMTADFSTGHLWS